MPARDTDRPWHVAAPFKSGNASGRGLGPASPSGTEGVSRNQGADHAPGLRWGEAAALDIGRLSW